MKGRPKKIIAIPEPPQHAGVLGTINYRNEATGKVIYAWDEPTRAKLEKERDEKAAKRARHAANSARSYHAKVNQPDKINSHWNNSEVVSPKSASGSELLQQDGIEQTAVLNCILRDLPDVCRLVGHKPNEFVFRNGVIAACDESGTFQRPGLKMLEEEFNSAHQENHPFLNFRELSRLWELCAFDEYWAEKTFGDWLDMRRKFVNPATKWWALTEVMEMDLDPVPHTGLVNFLFPWDNIGLNREYTRAEFHAHLLEINGGKHRKLLCYPRSFYKSTTVQADLVIAQCALPDLTTLIVTATHPLSQRFTKKFRSFFTVVGHKRTLLQQLYPEFTIAAVDGTQFEYSNPMARFFLADPSVRSTSMGSTNAGSHTLYQIYDDATDEESSATEQGRLTVSEKCDAISETLDAPFGFQMLVGTRYCGGEGLGHEGSGLCPDLYGVQLNREAVAAEKSLEVLIKGAWWAKPGYENKPAIDLEEGERIYLWPSSNGKGSQKVLEGKRAANKESFSHQQLNIPCGFQAEDLHIFSREEFKRGWLSIDEIPNGAEWSCVWDLSYGRQDGDFSCGIVFAKWRDADGRIHLAAVNSVLKKLKPSLIAHEVVDLYRYYADKIKTVYIEKPHNFEDVEDYLREASRVRLSTGVVPYVWIPRDLDLNAKTSRIKSVQALSGHNPPLFHFVTTCNNLELIFAQFEYWIPGKKSGKSDESKDDAPDVCGLAVRVLNAAIQPAQKPVPVDNQPRDHWGRTREEAEAAWKAGEPARSAAMVREMQGCRAAIEAQQSQQARQAKEAAANPQWQKSPFGGSFLTPAPIDASGRRSPDGSLISKYGIPQRKK